MEWPAAGSVTLSTQAVPVSCTYRFTKALLSKK
jgi:hypothetical protein